jgi:hypothetical protein
MRACKGPEGAALALEHVGQAQAVPVVGVAMVMCAPSERSRNRWAAVTEWKRAVGE